uniref:Pentatricopeptide repeat-containing protein n=1 Tax=Ananas comosus var. bracteatus TaxID=296719 RepID=A0A6V7QEL1_ANACO|nr:unnamed protein product [Ananas comosus var. bracteatus]
MLPPHSPKTLVFPKTRGFSRALSSTHVATIPSKDAGFSLPNWRNGKSESRSKELRLHDAFLYLEFMVGKGHKPDPAQATQLLYDLCKLNKIRKAVRVMELMVRSGKVVEAFSILQNLASKQNASMHDFYRNVISFLCKKGNTYAAFQLLHEITRHGFVPDSYTNSSLIRGLCMEGMLDEAIEIFEVMEENGSVPDLDNYNALILGLCKAQRTDLSFDIYETMIAKGYVPNETTYTILVEGIAHEDETDLAAEVLKELHMRNVISQNTMERITMQYDLE